MTNAELAITTIRTAFPPYGADTMIDDFLTIMADYRTAPDNWDAYHFADGSKVIWSETLTAA